MPLDGETYLEIVVVVLIAIWSLGLFVFFGMSGFWGWVLAVGLASFSAFVYSLLFMIWDDGFAGGVQ